LIVEKIELSEEVHKQSERWRASIHEISRWADDETDRPVRSYQKDPAFKDLSRFASKFLDASKRN